MSPFGVFVFNNQLMLRSMLPARVCDARPTGSESPARGRKACGRARQRPLTRASGSNPGASTSVRNVTNYCTQGARAKSFVLTVG